MAAKSDEDTITNERPIKCVISGDGFTDKTTLAMKLQDPEVDVTTLEYIPAQYDEFGRKVTVENGNEVEVSVWDTAENEECRRLMQLNYIIADVFILTYKLTHPHTIENIQSKWAKLVRHWVPGAPIIIVGTHCDRNLDSAEGTDVKARLAEVAENVGADKCLES